MNWIFEKIFNIHIWAIIFFLVSILLCAAISLYFYISDYKIITLLGGSISGLICFLMSFLLSMYDHHQMAKLKTLGIVKILPHRKQQDYYTEIIRTAKNHVWVMGTSCTRFIEDFADTGGLDHVLIDALDKNLDLEVKLLIPTEEEMDDDSKSQFNLNENQKRMQGLKKYNNRFQIKRYSFEARHSLFRVDDDIIIGPIFPQTESQHSSAIHFNNHNFYADEYRQYFYSIWKHKSISYNLPETKCDSN